MNQSPIRDKQLPKVKYQDQPAESIIKLKKVDPKVIGNYYKK
jgi:hypothetical protein